MHHINFTIKMIFLKIHLIKKGSTLKAFFPLNVINLKKKMKPPKKIVSQTENKKILFSQFFLVKFPKSSAIFLWSYLN